MHVKTRNTKISTAGREGTLYRVALNNQCSTTTAQMNVTRRFQLEHNKRLKITESQNGRGWKGPLWVI